MIIARQNSVVKNTKFLLVPQAFTDHSQAEVSKLAVPPCPNPEALQVHPAVMPSFSRSMFLNQHLSLAYIRTVTYLSVLGFLEGGFWLCCCFNKK